MSCISTKGFSKVIAQSVQIEKELNKDKQKDIELYLAGKISSYTFNSKYDKYFDISTNTIDIIHKYYQEYLQNKDKYISEMLDAAFGILPQYKKDKKKSKNK